eukprot:TRINITY_DN19336_c0_g1_i2.p1 TRINITY_DN19336_c0_g1~~TRINITY_DN19336_c0_g1_i2.p1  ORF type:complete len:211 (-),score=-16.15 TRINITY_DN19336_c0_g1_i2:3-635(-)
MRYYIQIHQYINPIILKFYKIYLQQKLLCIGHICQWTFLTPPFVYQTSIFISLWHVHKVFHTRHTIVIPIQNFCVVQGGVREQQFLQSSVYFEKLWWLFYNHFRYQRCRSSWLVYHFRQLRNFLEFSFSNQFDQSYVFSFRTVSQFLMQLCIMLVSKVVASFQHSQDGDGEDNGKIKMVEQIMVKQFYIKRILKYLFFQYKIILLEQTVG